MSFSFICHLSHAAVSSARYPVVTAEDLEHAGKSMPT